ncbi:MAG: gliding motility-associated C-terminal domain-containing protein [Flavobacteriaceae bacterium]
MKKSISFILLLVGCFIQAQTALYNQGNLRIHENGQMGFHTDLINDGAFDENLGLAGFYSNDFRDIYGAFPPTFYDVEFDARYSTALNTTVNVTNNANFIRGNLFTQRVQSGNSLHFLANAFYTGEGNFNKVDGYASVIGQQNFTFPIGDYEQLRPLIVQSSGVNAVLKCAYFAENPNSPPSLDEGFDTERRAEDITGVSRIEFWRLIGNVTSTISISWNQRSAMSTLTDDINTIIPVGFSKGLQQWISLGNTERAGDLSEGFVTSAQFNPDDFDAISFGTLGEAEALIDLGNYLVTPNGDGVNDFLEIPELELSPNNHMYIYDRFGLKVFEQKNYSDEFRGFANSNNFVINRDQGLPSGIYFYVVSMQDVGLEFQGFFYLAQK